MNFYKKCGRCSEEKQLDLFPFDTSRMGNKIPRSYCRKCKNELNRATRERKKYLEKMRMRGAARRQRNNKFVYDYLKSNHCVDCGESNPVVLEFDHIRGEKRMGVSELRSKGYSIQALREEIDKCEVRCANCHRMKTAKNQSWHILLME